MWCSSSCRVGVQCMFSIHTVNAERAVCVVVAGCAGWAHLLHVMSHVIGYQTWAITAAKLKKNGCKTSSLWIW